MTRPEDEQGDEITEQFREDLGRWLDTPGNSRNDLAERVGCSGPLISQIRGGYRKRTSLMRAICQETGIRYPHQHLLVAEAVQEIERHAPGYVDEKLAELTRFLKSLRER